MKKYQQLLLLITSVVSLSLLFVYRHEYNRLHYVLEVFNFFGQPCNVSELQNSDTVPLRYDWGAEPVWQETNNIYVYSAFWETDTAKALALHTNKSKVLITTCYLWFEDRDAPVIGKLLSFHDAFDKNNYKKFTHHCKLKISVKHAPYAVSFSTKTKQPIDLLKKHFITQIKHAVKKEFDATVCVIPTPFSKTNLLEFVSYHKLIGINNFLFYGPIPHRLNKIISNLSNKLAFKISSFTWNYPDQNSMSSTSWGNLARKFIEHDCILRSAQASNSTIVLNLNEYVVLANSFSSFNELILQLTSPTNVSLPVQKFCLENFSRRKPLILQNTRAFYDNQKSLRLLHVVSDRIASGHETDMNKQVASIHHYVKCPTHPKRVYTDDSVLKYSTDLIRSTLVQLNLHDNI